MKALVYCLSIGRVCRDLCLLNALAVSSLRLLQCMGLNLTQISPMLVCPVPAILNRTTRRGIGSHGHKTEALYAGGVFASGASLDQLLSSRATSTRGSITSLRFTMRSRMS